MKSIFMIYLFSVQWSHELNLILTSVLFTRFYILYICSSDFSPFSYMCFLNKYFYYKYYKIFS